VFGEGVGSGAIYEAARILEAFRTVLREPGLTYSTGLILGGTEVRFDSLETRGMASGKSNVIPASAVVVGDVRTLTDDQLRRTQERMRAIVAAGLPQSAARITFDEGYPSMPATPGNLALLAVLNGVNQALGVRTADPNDPARRGAGDISFVAPYVSGVGGLGADGTGSHTDREVIDLTTLPRQIKRAALLIYRLTR
jgi:glutamate carboxypeptidase